MDAAREIVWPVVRNDLAFVAEFWNTTSFGKFLLSFLYRYVFRAHYVLLQTYGKNSTARHFSQQQSSIVPLFWAPISRTDSAWNAKPAHPRPPKSCASYNLTGQIQTQDPISSRTTVATTTEAGKTRIPS